MVVKRSVLLYKGEIGISRTGIYTKMHKYRHPKTQVEVRLAGMLHTGEAEYYKAVQDILNSCEHVLYERLPVVSREKSIDIVLPEVDDGVELFMSAVQAYFAKLEVSRLAFIKKEAEIFKEAPNLENWTCGDIVLDDEIDEELSIKNGERITERLRRSFRKNELYKRSVELALLIKKLKNRTFNKHDFARGMLLVFQGHTAAPFYIAEDIKRRDLYCFEKFDEVVTEQNPQSIGIKFGAGHMANQRRLLKKRGYEHISSKKLFCVRF